jgi:hypothetical protein
LYATSSGTRTTTTSGTTSKEAHVDHGHHGHHHGHIPAATKDALQFFFGDDPATTKEIESSQEPLSSTDVLIGQTCEFSCMAFVVPRIENHFCFHILPTF